MDCPKCGIAIANTNSTNCPGCGNELPVTDIDEANKEKKRFMLTLFMGGGAVPLIFMAIILTEVMGTGSISTARVFLALGAMLIGGGLLQIVLVSYNWNVYKRDFRVKAIIKISNEVGAKVFYELVGVVIIVMGILFATGVIG